MAADPFFLQLLRGIKSLPGRRDFDQHPFAWNFALFVKFDQRPRFLDGTLDIVRQSRIGLGRYAPRHNLQNVAPELDKEMITDVLDLRLAAQTRFLSNSQHFVEQVPVLLLLSSGKNQAWVRRCVLRLEFLDRFKIRRVGDDLGEFLKLVELVQFRFGFFLFGNSGAHNLSCFFAQRTPERRIDNGKSAASSFKCVAASSTSLKRGVNESDITPKRLAAFRRTAASQAQL